MIAIIIYVKEKKERGKDFKSIAIHPKKLENKSKLKLKLAKAVK